MARKPKREVMVQYGCKMHRRELEALRVASDRMGRKTTEAMRLMVHNWLVYHGYLDDRAITLEPAPKSVDSNLEV